MKIVVFPTLELTSARTKILVVGILSLRRLNTKNYSWDGLVDSDAGYFTDNYSAVRPIIYYSTVKPRIIQSPYDADKFYFNDHVFRVIDSQNEIAIAEVPISFDFFDYSSRNYESSSIRQKLNYWFETGIWIYNLDVDEHWWLE